MNNDDILTLVSRYGRYTANAEACYAADDMAGQSNWDTQAAQVFRDIADILAARA